jgi:hypothetical protein
MIQEGVIIPPDFKNDTLTRILCYILDTVDEYGCWGATDFENWGPIITVLTANLLLQCGFSLDTKWVVGTSIPTRHAKLLGTFSYLDGAIQSDGSFGEDVWDAARLCELIHKYNLESHFTRLSNLNAYITQYISTRAYRQTKKTWDGPGTIAALLRVCEVRGDETNANQLFDELQGLQLDSGEFHGTVAEDGNDLSSPVWHTAQALIAFLDRGISQKDSRVLKIVNWFVRTQNPEGAWRFFHRYDVYFTAYGVLALSRLSSPPDALAKAITWLEAQVAPTGKVADAGGTLMAGLALGAVHGFRFEGALKGADYHNARKLAALCSTVQSELDVKSKALELAERQNSALQFENKRWSDRFGGADFGLSTKAAWIIGIMVAIAFGGGVLATSKVVDYFFNCPACHTPNPTGEPSKMESEPPSSVNEPSKMQPQNPSK